MINLRSAAMIPLKRINKSNPAYTLIIIENDLGLNKLIQNKLKGLDFFVRSASSGAEAQRILEDEHDQVHTISAMYVGGITAARTSLKATKKVLVKKMFEGRVTVDRYSADIFEPVEEKTFDRNSFKQAE
jgi:hypothetical protein